MKYLLKYKEFLMEKQVKSEKGCLMLYLDDSQWSEILNTINIDNDDLHEFGLEKEPHITILFGFNLDKVDKNDIQKELQELQGKYSDIKIGIDKTTLFKNEQFDVVKCEVKSNVLNKLNKYFADNYSYENDYPDYNPHITIAYVKPGKGKKYNNINLNKYIFKGTEYVYSERSDEKDKVRVKI